MMCSLLHNVLTMLVTAAIGLTSVHGNATMTAIEMRLAVLMPKQIFIVAGFVCGVSSFRTYRLVDGREIVEGTSAYEDANIAEREFRALVRKASTVVEHNPQFTNRSGRSGERFVLIMQSEDRARILWYGGKNYFTYLTAPSLDVALTFEKVNAYFD